MTTEAKKESFILYTEQNELFEELSNEEAGKLIKGIFNYVKTGELPEFNGTSKMAFIPIRQMLDRNAEKYEEKREKMSQNGKKGGRPPLNHSEVEKNTAPENSKSAENTNNENTKSLFSLFDNSGNKVPRDKKEDTPEDFREIVKRRAPELYEYYEKHKKRLLAQN